MKKKKIMALLTVPVLTVATMSAVVAKDIIKPNASPELLNKDVNSIKSISCTFPVKGESVNILKPSILSYISAMKEQAKNITVDDYTLHDFYVYAPANISEPTNDTDLVRVKDYFSNSSNMGKSKKVNLVFNPLNFDEGSEYEITISTKPDLSDGKVIRTVENFVSISNLHARTKYYWQVSSGTIKSEIESFVTDEGFRYITADGIANIRDMGGRPVAGGKHIKQGLIFRGGEVVYETVGKHTANITEENAAIFTEEMGIGYEIDFRGDDECGYLTESPLKTYYQKEKQLTKDIEYQRISNMGAYHYFFQMSSDDPRWQGVKNMFLAFKNANEKHVYFHCWGGADRTGTAGFLLGGLLGMSYTDLVIDYELTTYANNYRPHNVNDPTQPSGVYFFPAFINALKTEKDKSGNLYYEEGKTISKIVEDILIDKAGLTSQDIADIKANLLED